MLLLVLRLVKLGLGLKKENAKKHQDWYSDNNNNNNNMQLPSQLMGGGARSPAKVLAECILRFFQFVMALTVTGLYGVDLNHDRQNHVHADSKWIYAEVTAGLSAITAMVYLFAPFIFKDRPLAHHTPLHLPCLIWECILCILWLTLFGVFGKIYISEDPAGNSGTIRMKHAVWVDLTNLLLWVITMIWCGVRCSKSYKQTFAGTEMKAAEGAV
jgi:hypothetical protein